MDAASSVVTQSCCLHSTASAAERRGKLQEFACTVNRVDTALKTLTTELMEMREQDLRLLKQLISIGETIQRLSRSRSADSSALPGVVSHVRRDFDLSASRRLTESLCTMRRPYDRRFSDLLGDRPDLSVPLLRRQSEPHLCHLDPYVGLPTSSSRRDSANSIGNCSVDATGSSDDCLDGSENDLDFSRSSITTIPDLTSSTPPLETDGACNTSGQFQRPKSHSIMALTFTSKSAFVGSHSAYSDILNRNVRLWKGRLAQARDQCHPEVASSLEEES